MTREEVLEYALRQFDVRPDSPFDEDFDTMVLRHPASGKWFGLIMNVAEDRLSLESGRRGGFADVLNVKCDPEVGASLVNGKSIIPAYHMNKEYWITAALDGSVPESDIKMLLDISFCETAKRKAIKKPSRNERRPDRFL